MMTDAGPNIPTQPDQTTRTSWWRRNRLWLAALIPLAVVALLASSFRLQRVYLPWYWTKPHVATGTTMTFDQDYHGEYLSFHRLVNIKVSSVAPVDTLDGGRPVAGGVLYRVSLQLSASPDQVIPACSVWLEGPDGTLYGSGTEGKVEVKGDYLRATVACVPEDAPGPSLSIDGKSLEPSPTPRPESWLVSAGVVLPQGVTPAKVRIGWSEPDYAVLDVPKA